MSTRNVCGCRHMLHSLIIISCTIYFFDGAAGYCTTVQGSGDELFADTDGSGCSCEAGYVLDYSGTSCSDVNECLVNNGGCDVICQNTVGSFFCGCEAGHVLSRNGFDCEGHEDSSFLEGSGPGFVAGVGVGIAVAVFAVLVISGCVLVAKKFLSQRGPTSTERTHASDTNVVESSFNMTAGDSEESRHQNIAQVNEGLTRTSGPGRQKLSNVAGANRMNTYMDMNETKKHVYQDDNDGYETPITTRPPPTCGTENLYEVVE